MEWNKTKKGQTETRAIYRRVNKTQVATIKGGADNHTGGKIHNGRKSRALKRDGKIKKEVQGKTVHDENRYVTVI